MDRQSSPSPPPRKKQKVVETVLEEDEDKTIRTDEEEQLLNVMDGDDFISQEEKEAQEAQRRRLLRKQRLQKARKDDSPGLPIESKRAVPEKQKEQQSNRDVGAMNGSFMGGENDEKKTHDDDGFDMFSTLSVSPPKVEKKKTLAIDPTSQGHHHQQDWDDEEGYYKATMGEEIDFSANKAKFRVLGIVGKGVFSTVLKCETLEQQQQENILPSTVGLKLIRHNDTMAKAAQSEIRHLQKLRNCNGIVQLHLPREKQTLEHRGHLTLVFDFAPYNLRHVLRKFGRGVGLSLTGVRAYFYQLLQALLHLEKHGLVHADLKPDNILVSEDFGTLQLCDFGSAFEEGSDSIPTPYLVSRFYRAPEIILGLLPTTTVDLWSVAVTVGELFLGQVLFDGRSNNDMLLQFMNALGIFSNRVMRQHVAQSQKFPLEAHFQNTSGSSFSFLHKTLDKVTGQPVTVHTTLLHTTFPKVPLQQLLLKAKSTSDSRVELLRLSDLMHKCLSLDPTRRIALQGALRHDFFQKKQTINNNGSEKDS